MGTRRAAAASFPVDSGTAVLERDPDRPRAFTLTVDGAPQGHVDLDDATYLDFEYVRRLGHVVDLAAEPGRPLAVLHLGAGALTLARYVAATRPGSPQRAAEVDASLVDVVRRHLPLDRAVRVRVQVADAREALARMRDDVADLVVLDAYAGRRAPAHLTTVELVRDASRVLRPGGTYAVNVADGPPLPHARGQVATVLAVFPYVCLLAEASVLRGRRFGNVVVVGSDEPLPLAGLVRRCAGDPAPARVVAGEDLRRFAVGTAVVTDATAVPSPEPPGELFRR